MGYYSQHCITTYPKVNEDVIQEFRDEYNYNEDILTIGDESNYASEMKGYEISKELIKFSKKYPELVFILSRNGEESLDYTKLYVKNGIWQESAFEKIVYTFDLNDFLKAYEKGNIKEV